MAKERKVGKMKELAMGYGKDLPTPKPRAPRKPRAKKFVAPVYSAPGSKPGFLNTMLATTSRDTMLRIYHGFDPATEYDKISRRIREETALVNEATADVNAGIARVRHLHPRHKRLSTVMAYTVPPNAKV